MTYMPPDERKWSLRAAVEAKTLDLLRTKGPVLDKLSATAAEADRTIRCWQIGLLWDVIDSMVDECAVRPADGGIQYRCIWEEWIAGTEGLACRGWVPFSGPVGSDIAACLSAQSFRRRDPAFRNVSIEARPASEGAWPPPWDCGA